MVFEFAEAGANVSEVTGKLSHQAILCWQPQIIISNAGNTGNGSQWHYGNNYFHKKKNLLLSLCERLGMSACCFFFMWFLVRRKG